MGRSTRLLAVLTMVSLLAAACSITTPLTSPSTTTSSTLPEGLSAAVPNDELPTAVVSFDEYSAALDALSECMVDSGASLSGRILDPVTGLYLYDYDPAFEQIHVECHAVHFATVDELYRAGPRADVTAGQFDSDAPAGDLTDVPADSWVRLLATVPDIPETRFNPITILDIARTREVHEIALPPAGAGDQAVIDYQEQLVAGNGLLPIGPMAAFGRRVTPTEMRLEVGFDLSAWDRIIDAGSADREHLAVQGRFDRTRIDTAVANDPVWNDLLRTIDHRDVAVYEWGSDGGLDLDRTTPVRSIGAFQRLALVDEYVLWMRFTDAVQEGIDAIQGRRRTLADVPELRRLAEIADGDQLLSSLMTMRLTPYVGYADNGRNENILLDQPLAVMYADGRDETGNHISLTLLYASPEEAEANLARFEERIADAAATTVIDEAFAELAEPRLYEIELLDDVLQARITKTRDKLPPPISIIRFN